MCLLFYSLGVLERGKKPKKPRYTLELNKIFAYIAPIMNDVGYMDIYISHVLSGVSSVRDSRAAYLPVNMSQC